MTSLTLVTAPDQEPVSLDEFNAWANLDSDNAGGDELKRALILAARQYLDGSTGILGRALLTQTWAWRLDEWPECGQLDVPLPPLQSVTHIKYIDTAGDLQTWDAANYQVDPYSTPGRILLAAGATFPALRDSGQINQVTVTFVAGYGAPATAVPQPIRQAIHLLASHWYENRTPVQFISGSMVEVPMTVWHLLSPHAVRSFG